ncbi:MBL fold metallo-hydrolase [Mycolicibacterium moriokaense]|jgi:glyoxylase-like metal-dependent hydrolase (beta-lactamase superfamily II)|uniref:MBL fold metallo-hydrolase n=1 Tax=Mycolicibacterium moriokaense TaxID=39691 RepID=A0AAD1HDD2_9MYCO|nr:MBL fold metallo-hydrolase [Mycolicibacterium moriokaense]MCV7038293.1 MBL fold metallo-hydrolase [Mycolicibacterium moriokaense]ORB24276.1 MBL fold metallo-hydrolase [Mycolicibacterium moriokaense]BBX02589.1 MBL fold metallo-hydrolase [Mycolicibacterium moriokaense]
MNFEWESLADGVSRCRLPFLDVTIGLAWSHAGALLVDTGTTLTEAAAIRADAEELAGREVSHIVLTHNHFDHVLGAAAFDGAAVYCAPAVATTMTGRADWLRADAVRFGANPREVDNAIAALRAPDRVGDAAVIDLGERVVSVSHPGRGHTDHDLIAVVEGADKTVVFCGDLVEESGDPAIDTDSDTAAWPATLDRLLAFGGDDARYVPGHGATVDAGFVRRQRLWIFERM